MYAVYDSYPEVDMTADGSKVLSWDNYGLVRMVNSDGSNPYQVIQLTGGGFFCDYRVRTRWRQSLFSAEIVVLARAPIPVLTMRDCML
jgi:hypothetical protein